MLSVAMRKGPNKKSKPCHRFGRGRARTSYMMCSWSSDPLHHYRRLNAPSINQSAAMAVRITVVVMDPSCTVFLHRRMDM